MTDSPSPASGRLANGRFAPGHPGGRRVGSRNRASHKMVMAVLADFEAHKADVLHRLRSSYSPAYFNTLARLTPPMLVETGPDFEDYSDEQAAKLVTRARQVLAVEENPRKALVALETVLANDLAQADVT
jgi:hypothetical protein